MTKKIVFIVLNILYKIISRLVPVNRNKVVFVSSPNFSDNSLAMYELIHLNYPEFSCVWLFRGAVSESYKIKCPAYLVKKNSMLGLWHFTTSAIVFHTHGCFAFAKGAAQPFQVGLWHGMPIKNIGRRNNGQTPQFSHVTLATSEYFINIISESFELDPEDVWLTGLPRNDSLFKKDKDEFIREKIKEYFNVDGYKDIVFWLPTFRTTKAQEGWSDSSSQSFLDEWSEGFFSSLDVHAGNLDKIVLIKLHPMDILNDLLPGFKYKNLRLISSEHWANTGLNLYESLSVSCGLISEVSSVIIDYIVTGKPIGITQKSFDFYSRGYIDRLPDLLGSFESIANEFQFFDFVARCDGRSYNNSLAHDFYAENLCSFGAAERVFKEVEKLDLLRNK